MLTPVGSRVSFAQEIATMAIQPIGVTTGFGQGNTLAATSSTRSDRQAPSTTVPTSTPTEAAPDETNNTHHAPRVMQLLEEGHFQGVSDLRLRMIFGDQFRADGTELPELSAPKGKGVAYAKFLEQYTGSPGSSNDDGHSTTAITDQPNVAGGGDVTGFSTAGGATQPINTLA